jgi:hypothetical protein
MLLPTTRTFGIEIECLVPRMSRAQVAAAITAEGVECYDAGYTHQTSRKWKIVSDGSLRGTGGMEIVSPPLSGQAGFDAIAKVSAALLRAGATVNSSCGLHVHVGASDLPVPAMRKLAAMYMENENVIDSLLPQSRRASNNVYCASIATNTNVERLQRATNATQIAQAIANGGRYVKLNFSSFWRHGTVEFRHHSGTVDAAKINKWALTCLRMVAAAERDSAEPITLATTNRPQGTGKSARRLRTIYDLLARPQGCTRQEVATALGRNTMPPLNRILSNAGFTYRVTNNHRVHGEYSLTRRTERYVLEATPTTAATAATLDTFMAKLEMADDEKIFWVERAALLRSVATRNQVAA